MSGEGILIVDDETLSARNLEQWVRRLAYEPVGIARTADEAVEMTGRLHPDLVLMDVRLQGRADGIEATREIHDHWDVPVVYVTCYSDEATLERAKQTEPYGYLVKPFDPSGLRSIVEMALHKHGIERRLRIRERYLAALEQVAQLLLSVSEEVPYQQFIDSIGPATRAQRAQLWLAETCEQGSSVRLESEWLATGQVPRRDRGPCDLTEPNWRVWCDGLVAQGVATSRPGGPPGIAWQDDASVTCLAVPLLVGSRLEGFLAFEDVSARAWEPVEIGFLRASSGDLSQAITRHRIEVDLRDSEQRNRRFLESLPDACFVLDHDLRFVFLNAAGEKMVGVRGCDLLGSRLLDVFPRFERTEFLDAYRQTLVTGEPRAATGEFTLPGQSTRQYEVHCSAVSDGIVIVAKDITERLRAQETIRESERRLHQAERLESLSILAGGIAHDFNNLLVAIMGNSDLGLRSLPADSSVRPLLEEIKHASVRAASLTARMLAFSGKGRFTIQQVRLAQLVDAARDDLCRALPPGVSLQIAHSQAPNIDGDSAQIRQALELLVINAGEAIEATGEVSIRTGSVQIGPNGESLLYSAKPLPAGRYAVLEVGDTGCGMDPQTLEKLFDPFFSTKFTGRGLGLPAVLGIVRGHRGGVLVESSPGRGTRVRLLFPPEVVASPDRDSAAQAQSPETAPVVLIVDDEDTVRRTAERMLANSGYEVLSAWDGPNALERLSERGDRVDLVVLDMTMPGMDGADVLRQIRRDWPGLPVLMCSGYPRDRLIDQFGDSPPDGFLHKPFELAELRSEIARALSLRDARDRAGS